MSKLQEAFVPCVIVNDLIGMRESSEQFLPFEKFKDLLSEFSNALTVPCKAVEFELKRYRHNKVAMAVAIPPEKIEEAHQLCRQSGYMVRVCG